MLQLLKSRQGPVSPARPCEVLVADDVVEITELITRWLEAEGHKVTRASSGREVIVWVQKRDFDIVVTDIVMPDGDGWDAILAVGRQRPETRVIAISGGGNLMPVEACLRVAKGVGADIVLKKPFTKADFLNAFNRLASH